MLSYQHQQSDHDKLRIALNRLEYLQKQAKDSGTYAVSGLLVNQQGDIIHQERNRVIESLKSGASFILNPTNHGERRIISWYWKHKHVLHLPEPNELTIITTLDPCMMCAACIIISGFNVKVDYHGGVNHGENQFQDFSFSPVVLDRLKSSFGYFKIQGHERRNQLLHEVPNAAFRNMKLNQETQQKLSNIFKESVEIVKHNKQSIGLQPRYLKNLSKLSVNHPLIVSLQQLCKFSLSLILDEKIEPNNSHHFEPSKQLCQLLEDLVSVTPLAKNAAALIDPHGNLLLARADNFSISPINLPYLIWFKQMNIGLEHQNNFKTLTAYHYLSQLEYCTFVLLNSLAGQQVHSLLEIRVYATAIKRDTLQSRLIYINDYRHKHKKSIQEVIVCLPLAYNQKHKDIKPIKAKIGHSFDVNL